MFITSKYFMGIFIGMVYKTIKSIWCLPIINNPIPQLIFIFKVRFFFNIIPLQSKYPHPQRAKRRRRIKKKPFFFFYLNHIKWLINRNQVIINVILCSTFIPVRICKLRPRTSCSEEFWFKCVGANQVSPIKLLLFFPSLLLSLEYNTNKSVRMIIVKPRWLCIMNFV